MTSIILAAGMGRRLHAGVPKCLLEIAGTTLLKRQIAAMRASGVTRFVIVVGYQQERVRTHLADDPGLFTFVVNERYAETNTIYSLYLAREHFGSGFLYANGDVLFDRRLTQALLRKSDPASMKPVNRTDAPNDSGVTGMGGPPPLEVGDPMCFPPPIIGSPTSEDVGHPDKRVHSSLESTVLAIKPGRCGQEEVKAIVHDGRIIRIGKQLDPARSLGEFVGVARFGSRIVPAFTEMLVRCVETEGIVGDHFEQAIDRLCLAGEPVLPIDIGDLPCGEIDFSEDLRYAITDIAPRLES